MNVFLKGVNMNLREYLFRNEMTKTEFAKRIGTHRNTLYLIIKGKVNPSLPMAKKIEEVTNGEVQMEDLLKNPKTKN